MLHALAGCGIHADMVVGSSVGALNGAYYAGNPTLDGVKRLETIWRGLRRRDVFPFGWRTTLGFLYRRDFLVSSDALRELVETNLTYRNLEDAKIPIHVVATNVRQRAARADLADRAAVDERAAGARRQQHRVFRPAAALPARRIAVRFFADLRALRTRRRNHRRVHRGRRP
jgi:Patatin-like phospholipase